MKRAIAVFLACATLSAQPSRLNQIADELIAKAEASGGEVASVIRVDPVTGASVMDGLIAAWLLEQSGAHQETLSWMARATDWQFGAHPEVAPNDASVLKAGAPSVASLAVDMGLVSRTTNGQLVTFRANPAGVAEHLTGIRISRPWDRLSVSATFDRNRAATAAEPAQKAFRQLAAVSGGLELWNTRRAQPGDWMPIARHLDGYRKSREALAAAFESWTNLRAWQASFAERIRREVDLPLTRGLVSADEARRSAKRIANDELEQLARLAVAPEVTSALGGYARELRAYFESREQLRKAPRTGTIVAVDYTVIRPEHAKSHWASTLIAQSTLGQRADFTSNITLQSGSGAQAATELSIPGSTGIHSLSVRAKRADMKRGPLEISLQWTWTLRLADGVRLPISLGAVRDPLTGAIRSQATLGVQLSPIRGPVETK